MEYLILTIQAPQDIDIWQKITKLVADMDCHIRNAQGQRLACESVLTVLISGNWNTIAKLETTLNSLKSEPNLLLTIKRSKPSSKEIQFLPYTVQVIALDQIGTLYHTCKFFSNQGIIIETLQFDSYQSSATKAPMFTLNVSIGVPSVTNIGELREQFMMFCDELNIDGVLEPEKR